MSRKSVALLVTSLVWVACVPLLGDGNVLARAQQPEKPAPPKEKKTNDTRMGNVRIFGYDKTQLTLDQGTNLRLTGPKTTIEVIDKQNKARLIIHAEEVQARKEKSGSAMVELRQNVRYTLSQTTPKGEEQTVEGTAGRASYSEKDKQVILTDGIQATLTDTGQFTAPATLRTYQVTVEMSESPYRYTIEGDAAVNDIQFAPKPKPTSEKKDKSKTVPVSSVHVLGFRSGEFQINKEGHYNGPNTTLEISNPADKVEARFQSETAKATFNEKGILETASASGKVRYHISQPAPKKEGEPTKEVSLQSLDGSCNTLNYNLKDKQIALKQVVKARIVDTESLLEPARLSADFVTVYTEKPFRYEVSGDPARTLFRFTPRPRPTDETIDKANSPKPNRAPNTKPDAVIAEKGEATGTPNKPFPLGTITLRGFESGTFAVGTEIKVVGDKTTFQTEDKKEKTSTLLQASRFTTTFAEDKTIQQAEALGNVRFSISRPSAKGDTQETAKGATTKAVLTNGAKAQDILIQGPFRVQVTSPEDLEEPADVVGPDKQDTLTVHLSGRKIRYDWETPNNTAYISFVPKEVAQKPDEKKPPAPGKKKG